MVNVLHVLGLHDYGGLEHLFVAYLCAMPTSTRPPAVAVKPDIHPDLRRRLHACSTTLYGQKYWGQVRLPDLPGLRRFNLRRIVEATSAEKVVFWNRLPTLNWVRACRRAGTQIIYYDHSRAWELNRSTAAPLHHADSAITVSAAGQRILQERLGFPGPVAVVPNGVRFPPVTAPPPPEPDGPLRLGFAGRLVDKKGVPVLLQAVKRLREQGVDFTLTVAGDGPAEKPLKRLTRCLCLSERVVFLGEVTDMPNFYRSIDVLVMPSLEEPFGLTSVEAATHGVPVIVSRVDGLVGTIVEGETGFSLPTTLPMSAYLDLGGGWFQVPEQVYDPDSDTLRAPAIIDPAALAELLAQLAPQRERLRAMGRHGIEHVRTHFSIERYVERLNGVLAA